MNEIKQGFYLINLGEELYELYGNKFLNKEIENQVKDLSLENRFIFNCRNKDPEIIKHIITTLMVYNTKRKMLECVRDGKVYLDPNYINITWGYEVVTINDLMKVTNPFNTPIEGEWTLNELVNFDILFVKESDEYPNKMTKSATSQIINLRNAEGRKTIFFFLKRQPFELIDDSFLHGHFNIIDIKCSGFSLNDTLKPIIIKEEKKEIIQIEHKKIEDIY